MTEAVAIRYLLSKGWKQVEEGWFSLVGKCNDPVCVEAAILLQRRYEA